MNRSLPSVPVLYPFPPFNNMEGNTCPLFFSCPLFSLTEEDAASLIRETGITTVLDLRTGEEESELPDFQIPGVLYLFAPLPPRSLFPDGEEQARFALSDERSLGGLRLVFNVLLYRGGPVLVHCADGHERCDLVSSLLLSALSGEGTGVTLAPLAECGGAEAFFRDRLGYRVPVLPLLREKYAVGGISWKKQ